MTGPRLKILIGNNDLTHWGGSEAWCATMVRALRIAGHRVDVFTATGRNSLIESSPCDFSEPYDIALVNHHTTLTALQGKAIRFRVLTCHGPTSHYEQPAQGADAYVAVSEEVQAHLKSRNFDASIIRNPIDLDLFQPRGQGRKGRVLFACGAAGKPIRTHAWSVIQEAARDMNPIFVTNRSHEDFAFEIAESEIVIGVGRIVQEALACQRRVVVYDYGGGDGAVTPDNLEVLRQRNFSGRTFKRAFTPAELRAEIDASSAFVAALPNARDVAIAYLQLQANTAHFGASCRDQLITRTPVE